MGKKQLPEDFKDFIKLLNANANKLEKQIKNSKKSTTSP
uniref:Uncharacterized protein n=1 Tax=uncultured bacterium contig00003 TaxID=1181495 RepID=A0A806KGK7_9BACT|nr:hypothetical protein [uncultured bacterium contig00003]